MESEIVIQSGHYSVSINRSKLLQVFPESLFAVILEMDTAAEVINLSQVCITPPILDAVKYMVETKEIPKVIPGVDYLAAGRYLLMDIFKVLGDPMLSQLPEVMYLSRIKYYEGIDPDTYLNPSKMIKEYKRCLYAAIWGNATLVAQYIMDHVLSSRCTIEIDADLLGDAVLKDRFEVFTMLLRRGVDPSLNQYVMGMVCESGKTEYLKLLLKDPRVDPSDRGHNYPITAASRNGHIDIVRLLLKDPRINPGIRNNEPLREAESNNHHEIVELLRVDPRLTYASDELD